MALRTVIFAFAVASGSGECCEALGYMRQIFHGEGLQQQFVRSGYKRVPMLSGTEVSHILSQLATLRPGDGFGPAGGGYHCSFLDANVDYKREIHRLIKRSSGPDARQPATSGTATPSAFTTRCRAAIGPVFAPSAWSARRSWPGCAAPRMAWGKSANSPYKPPSP